MSTKDDLPALTPLELRRIASLPEAAKFLSLSEDTIRRRYGKKIRQLSPRRVGIMVGDLIKIAAG